RADQPVTLKARKEIKPCRRALTMSLIIANRPVPLKADNDGVVRVGGTRVTLDTLVAAFTEGATPEEIVQQYPSLNLADVYSVIAYYLRQRTDVEAYLQQRQRQVDK